MEQNYQYVESELSDENLEKITKKHVIFGEKFNSQMKNLPNFIEEITFISDFSESSYPLDNLPVGLKKLELLGNFNGSVDFLPVTLQSLRLGFCFNHPVDNLPPDLKFLIINLENFNHSIDNLPDSIETLILGYFHVVFGKKQIYESEENIKFDKKINKLPKKLKFLLINPEYKYLDEIREKYKEKKIYSCSNYIFD